MIKKIALVIVILFVAVIVFLLDSRFDLYNYDVAADYEYDFSSTEAVVTTLDLIDGRATLPASENSNISSFLKVKVNGTSFSYLSRPSVVMSNNERSESQYFEHGASGARVLNVSKLVSNVEQVITLTGNHLLIEDGNVELIQFENPVLEEKRILILAPHPDDAEIAAFGIYSNHDDIFIATITSGDAGPFMYDEIYSEENEAKEHYLKKGEVRTWNSLAVPMLGGVPPEKIVNLGYNDARLRAMYRDKDMIAAGLYTDVSDMETFRSQNTSPLADGLVGINNWTSLVNNLEYLISEINPDIIITPSPMLDQHSDHRYTTIAAIEALKNLGRQEGEMLLYTNHQIEFNERFPYGEIGSVISLPPTPRGSNYFRRLFSYPMDLSVQRDKIFALDAMNDLRLGTDYRFVDRSIALTYETFWMQITGKDESYFRRSVRSNEFFYVVDVEDIYDEIKVEKF